MAPRRTGRLFQAMTYPMLLRAEESTADLVTEVRLTSPQRIEGHVFDPNRLDARFVVELYVDGQPAALTRAELYDDRLREQGVGDGCYRYAFAVGHLTVDSASSLEVRIANSNRSAGSPIAIADISQQAGACFGAGEVRWTGGLRFSGWVSEEPQLREPEVRVFIDGTCVARATPRQWGHIDDCVGTKAVRGFELHLPREFADGRVRRASFVDDLARPLIGSPCAFFAFEDGLANFLSARGEIASEKIRGALYDQCFPQSLPFDLFEEWTRAFPVERMSGQTLPKLALALVGDRDAETSVASLQTQVGIDWVAGILCGGTCEMSFHPEQLLEFLDGDAANCDFVVFALSGTLFRENAFARLVESLELHPSAWAAYCDVTMATEDGREWPIAFPSFDYERLLEQGYCAYLFALPIAKAREAARAGADNLFRVFNIALDGGRPAGSLLTDSYARAEPVHVPGFLARIPRIDLASGASRLAEATVDHLRACGIAAPVERAEGALFPCVRVRRAPARAKVSLLIPTRDRVDLLQPCVESLRRTLSFDDHEVIVIDNDTSDPETLDYLEGIGSEGVKVASLSGGFNFAQLINQGAADARGEYLLVMSNSVRALEAGWLEEMLGRAAEPDVGAVGAALLWPSGVVQHGGTVLGVGFAPVPAFGERIDGDPGYADQLIVAHECSAVAGPGLLTPRGVFLDVGGFDGVRFPLEYHEVDYCLRLRERGFRVVFAPRARLRRGESARRREPQTQNAVAQVELARLRSRWGEVLIDDPCYSPLLSLNGAPYSGLAWPPRSLAPRLPKWAAPRPIPSGF
jgi:O-antigen biosynthesis protein